MSSVHPRIVNQDATLRALKPVPAGERQFDEAWLQELLFRHPELLPVDDIDPDFGRLVTVIDAQPTYTSVVMEKYLSQMGDPSEAYRTYRATVRDIPAVQQVFARNGRYVNHDQMTLEQVQTLLDATDRFARKLLEKATQ